MVCVGYLFNLLTLNVFILYTCYYYSILSLLSSLLSRLRSLALIHPLSLFSVSVPIRIPSTFLHVSCSGDRQSEVMVEELWAVSEVVAGVGIFEWKKCGGEARDSEGQLLDPQE
jgi:hypothetical protein